MSNNARKKDLERRVELINSQLPAHQEISLDWMMGQPRVVRKSRDLSPRLTKNQMRLWLDAFIVGLEAGFAGAAIKKLIQEHGS